MANKAVSGAAVGTAVPATERRRHEFVISPDAPTALTVLGEAVGKVSKEVDWGDKIGSTLFMRAAV